jgi:hypothetical protein
MLLPANTIFFFLPLELELSSSLVGAIMTKEVKKPAASEFFLARYITIDLNYVPSVRYLKTLAGNRKIDHAVLQKLNTLTREEARMAILY